MKHFLTLSISLALASAGAQPIINSVNLPILGDNPPIIYCTDVPVESTLDAETGANYNWDFSGLTTESVQGFDFVDPSSTPWAADFTGSDVCGVDEQTDAHTYYMSNSSALSNTGYRFVISPGDTLEVNYGDPEQIIDFPFTYNDYATDAFSGNGVAAGFSVTMNGSISYTADGYGTLVLPNATYQNVIRYRMDRTETTSFQGFPSGTVVKDQWVWISADYRYWLLLMELIDDGAGVDDNVWYQSSPQPVVATSIAENTIDAEIDVYPNPATVGEVIRFSRPLASNEHAEVYGPDGRIVWVQSFGNSGFTIPELALGVYTVLFKNADQQIIKSQKLIVQ